MRLRTLEFILREATTNIYRNVLMSLACITTVMVSLGFSGSIVLAFRNVQNLLSHVAQELEVAVYLKTEVTPDRRDEIGQLIAAVPHVQAAPILISKEHAWITFSASIPASLKAEVDENPLPDTFMARVDTPSNVPVAAKQIELIHGVDKVNAPYLEAQRAAAILKFAGLAASTVTALLLVITTFLVMNTIRLTLYARRDEIRVMQLVGATNGYIRAPFILEGLILGVAGGGLAAACLSSGYPYLLQLVRQSLAFDLPLLTPGTEMLVFYLELAGIGAAVGAFGSMVSVRRFLRPVDLYVSVRRLDSQQVKELDDEMARAQEVLGHLAGTRRFAPDPADRPRQMNESHPMDRSHPVDELDPVNELDPVGEIKSGDHEGAHAGHAGEETIGHVDPEAVVEPDAVKH